MKTVHEALETSALTTPLVRDRLLTIEWGSEAYPTQLLELHDVEQAILTQLSAGSSLKDISKSEGLPYPATLSRYYAAKGKVEAQSGLEGDILELSPLAQRVVVLNSIFGSTWNRANTAVIRSDPEIVISTARQLDGLLGDKWKRCPQISIISVATIKERIARYDAALSTSWRNSPVLLTQDPEVIERRAIIYDGWFGDKWRVKASILTNDPNTVISSVRALRSVGITEDNTPPAPYFGLLGTTVANKRRKAAFIRRELLGHQQVYIQEEKKPISEIVKTRKSQTADDKKQEAIEIEEFRVFLQHLGAKGLSSSVSTIRSWAYLHGYPAKPSFLT